MPQEDWQQTFVSIYSLIVQSLVYFVAALQHSHLILSTHIAAVVAMNNLLTELKNQSGGGGKGGAEKHCHSYQAGGMARRQLQGDVLYRIPLLFLSGSWELPNWCCQQLAISNMLDPIISCIAVGRVIFSCLLTVSQVPQAGAGFSGSRLFAGAWQ